MKSIYHHLNEKLLHYEWFPHISVSVAHVDVGPDVGKRLLEIWTKYGGIIFKINDSLTFKDV